MFRRRRKARVQWLPNIGLARPHTAAPGEIGQDTSGFDITFTADINETVTFSAPLLRDNPPAVSQVGAPHSVLDKQPLQFSNQYGYRLRRIVGKIFCSAGFTVPDAQNNVPPDAVQLSCGIIVRRVNEEDGTPLADADGENVNSLDNNADPWIWRRDWILGHDGNFANDGQTTINTSGLRCFPGCNSKYGSVKDGAHIDQKTARIIGPEERLFMNMSVDCLPFAHAAPIDTNPIIYVNCQYRILGTVMTNAGNRRNASR